MAKDKNAQLQEAKCGKLNNGPLKTDFPGGSDGKESACNAGDPGWIPGSGRSLEKGMATLSSILVWKNPKERGSRWATGHGITESDTTE